MNLKKLLILISLLFLLTACENIPGIAPQPPTLAVTPTTAAAQPEATATPAPGNIPVNLLLWLPPEFDPAAETEASALLADRLAAFTSEHPGTRIETRIKADEGEAGLYNALLAANASAPLTLPDMVFLPTLDMRKAAENDLILPLDDYIAEPFDENWYEFSHLLGMHREQVYGLPLAVDALVMVYRPSLIGDPPGTWERTLNINGMLSFPAADPEALFTMALYLSQAHSLYDENQELNINQAVLESIFNFYNDGQSSGVIPYWLIQYQEDLTSWSTFQERQTEMSITWSTRYLQAENPTFNAAPLPTRDGAAFTFVKSWTLVLPAANEKNAAISAELAQFLTAPEFMGPWTQAVGYLPPRVDALANWQEGAEQSLASQVLPQAWPLPPQTDFDLMGTPLSTAVIAVLKQEITPVDAAKQIVETLTAH